MWQPDMIVGDHWHRDLRDRGAVDQMLRRDQHAVDEQCMVRRQQKVALRAAGSERVRADANRPRKAWIGMTTAIDGAMADPCHATECAICQLNTIADAQRLDQRL